MSVESLEVVLVVSIEALGNKEKFEKHLKKEGFSAIEGEPFSYIGETSTHKINTVIYIFDVVKQGILKSGFETCKIIFQIGDYPMEAYEYNIDKNEFEGTEL